jgi:hypothetical protein
MFEEKITPSTNGSSAICLDDLGTGIYQVQLCGYVNLVG